MFSSIEERDYFYNELIKNVLKFSNFGLTHVLYDHNGAHSYRRLYRKLPSGGSLRPYVHQIIALKRMDIIAFPPNTECSHLCHIKDCVNPDHIVIELKSLNKNRKHCTDQRNLTGDLTYCSRAHTPHCLPGF